MLIQFNEKQFYFKQFSKSIKLNASKYYYVSLTIQLNIRHLFTHLNDQIQFSLSIVPCLHTVKCKNSSISAIDKILSGATTPGQSGPVNKGNKGVICIPQSSSITETSPSECLVSYSRFSLREYYPSAEMESEYSEALADWATSSLSKVIISNDLYKIHGFFFSIITNKLKCTVLFLVQVVLTKKKTKKKIKKFLPLKFVMIKLIF